MILFQHVLFHGTEVLFGEMTEFSTDVVMWTTLCEKGEYSIVCYSTTVLKTLFHINHLVTLLI